MNNDLCRFEKSLTHENLMRAFAGESQARNRYTFAASQCAAKELFVLQKLFLFTAEQEKEHAELFYHRLAPLNGKNIAIHAEYPVGNYSEPAALLRDAQHNEMQEYSHDYRLFSQIAQQEGFDEIAKLFKLIAEIEHTHSQRFMQYADLLDSGRLFSETEHTAWLCLNCGHIHTGTQAPGICPVCTHPQGYFIRAQQTIGA
jgi:rubrerythrin